MNINEHYKINIYFALCIIINYMSERLEGNNSYVLNCMQGIILNDKPNINFYNDINQTYGFVENNIKTETVILNRMCKSVHKESNLQSKINFVAQSTTKLDFQH